MALRYIQRSDAMPDVIKALFQVLRHPDKYFRSARMQTSRPAKTFLMLFVIAPLSASAVEGELHSASWPASDQHMQFAAAEVQPSTTLVASDEDSRIALSGFEIQKAFAGFLLHVDQLTKQNAFSINEWFFPDGTWERVVPSTVIWKSTGVWRINNDQICTRLTHEEAQPVSANEICRQVWRDNASGRIAMFDGFNSRKKILYFASSPITRVK